MPGRFEMCFNKIQFSLFIINYFSLTQNQIDDFEYLEDLKTYYKSSYGEQFFLIFSVQIKRVVYWLPLFHRPWIKYEKSMRCHEGYVAFLGYQEFTTSKNLFLSFANVIFTINRPAYCRWFRFIACWQLLQYAAQKIPFQWSVIQFFY